ncbi:hypothetical protein, conserved [Eimeria brunetti]|uniref:DNA cross-link repair protein n=1 Tax=Eimeria brunetti TaxID=51314 RepID=U6LM83_9EIME|nr:hypothetical protein, conserved [Eimeria brunetti]
MPLSAPLGGLNVFVDFFGHTPTGRCWGPPEGTRCPQGPPAPRLRREAVGPAVKGSPWVNASPRSASPSRGKRPPHEAPHREGPHHEGPLEERLPVDGSAVFGCSFCVPSLFVLTHLHRDHLRGLHPSWGRHSDGTPARFMGPSKGPCGGLSEAPRGPIVCTETTRQLLLRTHPKLETYVLPLQLQTPYLFYVQRAPVEASVGCFWGPSGKPYPREQHRPGGPRSLRIKAEDATKEEDGNPVDPPEDVIQPEEGKEVQLARAQSSSSSGKRQQTWSELLVERAAAAVHSSSSSNNSPGSSSVCCCGREVDRVYIQLVDARHCPGSALLLLRSPAVGSYVHTGDFCCSGSNLQPLLQQVHQGLQLLQQLEDPAAASAAAAAAAGAAADVATAEQASDRASRAPNATGAETSEGLLSQQQRQLQVDVLYLDNTYLHPRFSFLSQEEAVEEMSLKVKEALKRTHGDALTTDAICPAADPSGGLPGPHSSSLHVVVGIERLGKESLLQQFATALKVPVGLSEGHFDSAAAAAAECIDCCAYDLQGFTRGFCCPVVKGAITSRLAAASKSNSSSSSRIEIAACGCPWTEEACTEFASSPQRQEQQQQHNRHQQQQLEESGREELSAPRRAARRAADAAVCLFAVPRRQLVKVVEALEASRLPTLGLLPSGGGLSFGSQIMHTIPISSHSSFSSLLEFVRALSPQKAVLLEPLPVPSCGCAALRRWSLKQGREAMELTGSSGRSTSSKNRCSSNLHENHTDEAKGSMVGPAGSRDMWTHQSSNHQQALDEPVALLLDDPEALDTILAVRAEGLDCIDTSICSSISRPTLGKGSSARATAVEAGTEPSGTAAERGSCSVYGAFKYDGVEGLSVFVRTTEVPTVVLGSGRRPFCPHGGPCKGNEDPWAVWETPCGVPVDRSSASLSSVQPERLNRGAPSLPSMCEGRVGGPQRLLSALSAVTNSGREDIVVPRKRVNRTGGSLRYII